MTSAKMSLSIRLWMALAFRFILARRNTTAKCRIQSSITRQAAYSPYPFFELNLVSGSFPSCNKVWQLSDVPEHRTIVFLLLAISTSCQCSRLDILLKSLDIIGNKQLSLMKCLSCAICCPEVMQSTGDLHHKISKLIPGVAKHIFDNSTPFDSTYHMLNHNAHAGY